MENVIYRSKCVGYNVRNLKRIKNRVWFERNSKEINSDTIPTVITYSKPARKFCKGRNELNINKKFCTTFCSNKSLKSMFVHTRDTV